MLCRPNRCETAKCGSKFLSPGPLIADWRFRAIDKDGSGTLSRAGFVEMVRVPKGSEERLVDATLERLDKNRDGFITATDAGREWEEMKLSDKNQDGGLSRGVQGRVSTGAARKASPKRVVRPSTAT